MYLHPADLSKTTKSPHKSYLARGKKSVPAPQVCSLSRRLHLHPVSQVLHVSPPPTIAPGSSLQLRATSLQRTGEGKTASANN